jgi:phytoene dehydrogenase-like protein
MKDFYINKIVNPKGLKKDQYDVIIIGAGIGGLVCGCYLAKAGMKVLIVEKNDKVGGYCTSFVRDGFTFDVGIHALPECGEKGRITSILKNLGLEKEIEIIRTKVNEIVITPDHRIDFVPEKESVMETLTKYFKKDSKNIDKFIKYLLNTSFLELFTELKDKTFDHLLYNYFKSSELKNIFKVFLGNLGLPSYKVSALTAAILYRDHLLNGGYYLKGGMQSISNKLAKKFIEYGGKILLSHVAEMISLKNNVVNGIKLKGNNFIKSDYVVSNADANHTFFNMVGESKINANFARRLKNLIPSSSAFIVYLGLKKKINNLFSNFSGLWYISNYNIDEVYNGLLEGKVDTEAEHLLLVSPSVKDNTMAPPEGESIFLILFVPYVDKKYWEENRERICENIIKRSEEIIPGLATNIIVKEVASPVTLEKYTVNLQGSIRGWAPLPSQITRKFVLEKTPIKNLYLGSHWSVRYAPGGVSMAMTSGYNTAKLILKERIRK